MKKNVITFLKIVLVTGFIVIGFYQFYKITTTKNLLKKNEVSNYLWKDVIVAKSELNEMILHFTEVSSFDSVFSEWLKLRIESDNTISGRTPICDSAYIYYQYAFNNFLFFPEKEQIIQSELYTLKLVLVNLKFQNIVAKLNDAIKRYNISVENYNTFYTSFPNSVFAKQKGLKRKLYFDIHYGIENKDPKALMNERRKWQKEIEEQHSFQD